MTGDEKPSVLIIGGLGYIGRWLAHYIHTNKLASEIRIVDKQLPQLAFLSPEFEEPCKNFKHADMSNPSSDKFEKVFERDNGSPYDYVFNCAGETKYGQVEWAYKHRNYELPVACGKEAAKRGVKVYIELSEGRVYGDGPKGKKESHELKPSLPMAREKLNAERDLQKIEGLNLVILRLANVYGPYCSKVVATAMCNARVHQALHEEMSFLWTKDLKINTVHVSDVTKSIWHAAEWYVKGKAGWQDEWGTTPIFNIVDEGDTSQGTVAKILESVFEIKTSFMGTVISQLAKLNIDKAVDEANQDVLKPWAEILEDSGITGPSPLSPFIEREQLYDADLSLDGTRFKSVTGYQYEVPVINADKVEEMRESYKKMNWWP